MSRMRGESTSQPGMPRKMQEEMVKPEEGRRKIEEEKNRREVFDERRVRDEALKDPVIAAEETSETSVKEACTSVLDTNSNCSVFESAHRHFQTSRGV